MSPVSRRDRFVDLAALLLIGAGITLYLVADGRLHAIAQYSYRHPGPRTGSALDATDRARYMVYGGVGLLVTGVIVGVAGAVRVARRRKDAAPL